MYTTYKVARDNRPVSQIPYPKAPTMITVRQANAILAQVNVAKGGK